MNEEILNNLFEFWTYIGAKTNKLIETENYKSISMIDSDWPNRVFSVSTAKDVLSKIIDLAKINMVPNIITIARPNSLENNALVKLLFRQKNMALELKGLDKTFKNDNNIRQVKTREDATNFAKTASESFEYKIDDAVTFLISKNPSRIRLFNYFENDECLGCGVIFFDSINNAGLHMIGTIPKARGKGIGNKVTEKLISETKTNMSKSCVLHASLMGERIYLKKGFVPFGEIETYLIKRKNEK